MLIIVVVFWSVVLLGVLIVNRIKRDERKKVIKYVERFIETYGTKNLSEVNLLESYEKRQGHLP